jgi:hypothetical protein
MQTTNNTDFNLQLIEELKSIIQEIEESKQLDRNAANGLDEEHARMFKWRTRGRQCSIDVIQNKINTIEKELGIQTVDEFKLHEYNNQKLEYGKYIVVRKDGKKHIEIYNNTGWAYNNDSIKYFYLPKFE